MYSNLELWAIENGYDPDKDYGTLTEGHLSPNFRATEFACNCCGELPDDCYPPQQLIDWLEDIRAQWGGKPVVVNSGYRCAKHNKNVGGAKGSQHLTGKAADFYISGVNPSEIYAYADKLVGDFGGVGKYVTFTHIDARGTRARW